jgi:hypothetical protein
MSSLGAFNVDTGDYVHPRFANKKDKYKCPDCGKGLILAKGNIRAHHFRHPKDSVNPCNHYSNPTESQIHKDAKRLIKSLLERKIPTSLIRSCVCCEKKEVYEIPEISETSVIQEEWTFEHNGKKKIADVAYLEDGERFCLLEICYTHKTRSEDRPEPWFEIDAETLIQMVNDNNNSVTSLVIPCIRLEKCEVCIEKEEASRIEFEARRLERLKEMEAKRIERMRESEARRIESEARTKKWEEERLLREDIEKKQKEESERKRKEKEEEYRQKKEKDDEEKRLRKEKKMKAYQEKMKERDERISKEGPFKSIEYEIFIREQLEVFEKKRLEIMEKAIEKEKKRKIEKEKRRLRELNKEKIRENLANK